MKKKILGIVLSIFMVCTMMVSVLVFPYSQNQIEVSASGTPIAYLTDIDGNVKGSTPVNPSSDNCIYVCVNLTDTPTDTVTVYVRTRDYSAISDAGDYDKKDETVVFDANSQVLKKSISIKVKSTQAAINGVRNVFTVEIYNASGATYSKTDSNHPAEIWCNSTLGINLKTGSNNVLEVYDKSLMLNTVDWSTKNGAWVNSYDATKYVRNEYNVMKQWGIRFYSTAYGTIYQNRWDCFWADKYTQTTFQFQDGNGSRIAEHKFYESDIMSGDTGINICAWEEEKDYADFNEGRIVEGYYGGTAVSYSTGTNSQHGENYHPDRVRIVRYNNYVDKSRRMSYIKMPENGKFRFYIHVMNSEYTVHPKLTIETRLLDYDYPKIKQYYVDDTAITNKDKLRIAVRFCEPVHVKSNAVSLSIYLNNDSNTNYSATYVGGSGTDTLVFEYNPNTSRKQHITLIGVSGIENSTSICDYGNGRLSNSNNAIPYDYGASSNSVRSLLHTEKQDPKSLGSDMSVSIDTRSPELSGGVDVSGIARSRTVTITISNIIKGGIKAEYIWTTEENLLSNDEYPNVVTDFSSVGTTHTFSVLEGSLTGTYYLHVRVTSGFGQQSTIRMGPYKFDNSPPVISNVTLMDNGITSKTFVANVTDMPYNTTDNIPDFYLVYSDTEINLDNRGIESKIVSPSSVTIDGHTATFVITSELLGLSMEGKKFGTFFMGFNARDELSNKSEVTAEFEQIKCYYDIRNLINVDISSSVAPKYNIYEKTKENSYGYDSATENEITFTLDSKTGYIDYSIYSIMKGDETLLYVDDSNVTKYGANFSNYFDTPYLDTATDPTSHTVKIKAKAGISGGFDIILRNGADADGPIISYTFKLYFSSTFDDPTGNYERIMNNAVLNNYVFMLGTNKFYYYDNASLGPKSDFYNGTNHKQAFSSKTKAEEYVKYNEILDFTAYRIPSASKADEMNSGSGGDRKASGESKTASVGQVWIRYKRSSWNMSEDSVDWVYYYYDEDKDTIDMASISANLKSALNKVVKTIVDGGSMVYLADSYLDNNGAPYLRPEQINDKDLDSNITLNNTLLRTSNMYVADTAIYSSLIETSYGSFPLSTNQSAKVSADNYVFYAPYEGIEKPLSLYTQVTTLSRFVTFMKSTGVYEIVEFDKNGIREYSIYIDSSAPTMVADVVKAGNSSSSVTFDSQSNGANYSVTSFTIRGLTNETDEFAYIALYSHKDEYLGVYRREFFDSNSLDLPTGSYKVYVYDRSGNHYYVKVGVNATELECTISNKDNEKLSFKSNRSKNDVYEFSIYKDNELIVNQYEEMTYTFEVSGFYTFYLKDIYGYEWSESVQFRRDIPSVTWRFDGEIYKGDTLNTRIAGIGNGLFVISTNCQEITFSFDTFAGYGFEFNEGAVYTKTDNGMDTRVTINGNTDWTVKIFYNKYPDICATYTCIMDTTPPNIVVSTSRGTFTYNEIQHIYNTEGAKQDGDIITPSSITFAKSSVDVNPIANGDSIVADYFSVATYDDSDVVRLIIERSGEKILDTEEPNKYLSAIWNEPGNYVVTAYDSLGNKATFKFDLFVPEMVNYRLDGKEMPMNYSSLTYMQDEGYSTIYGQREYSYTKVDYANSNAQFSIPDGTEISILLYDADNNYKFFRFDYSNKQLLSTIFRMSGEKAVGKAVKEQSLLQDFTGLDKDSIELVKLEEYGITIIGTYINGRLNLEYVFNSENALCPTIEMRYITQNINVPYYFKIEFSNEKTGTRIIAGEKVFTPDAENYSNSGFTFAPVTSEKITRIEMFYSTSGYYDTAVVIYDGLTFTQDTFTDEGYFLIYVYNVYGNRTEYIVINSTTFELIYKAYYADGNSNIYGKGYEGTIKSNNEVEITVYSEFTTDITLDGKPYTAPSEEHTINGGTITFIREGEYVVTVSDLGGNFVTKQISIRNQPLLYDEDFLRGFNNQALLKAQGYTNMKLELNPEALEYAGIGYVSYEYKGTTTVLYDTLSEHKIPLVTGYSIGNDGDGEYVLLFRDEYGNNLNKTINYMGNSPFEVSRLTRSMSEYEPLSFDDILKEGVWANNRVKFSSSAIRYEFTVNGNQTSCSIDKPYELTYPDSSEIGKYTFKITYIDAYGFRYEFDVFLERKEIFIKLPEDLQLDNSNYITNKPVFVTFDEGLIGEYILNDVSYPYTSGYELYRDGKYRFVVSDKSGNVASATIIRDTIVEFSFEDQYSGKKLVNGDVTNGNSSGVGRVKLVTNKEYVRLDSVFLNGVEYDEFDGVYFTQNGRWEIMLSDTIGNVAYFCFYVLTGEVGTFSYNTPYGYTIESALFDNGSSVVSYMNFVNQEENYSSINWTESGTYKVTMRSEFGSTSTFTVKINSSVPQAKLVGCENGESTINNISLSGYQVGDTIQIYKDGQLFKTMRISTSTTASPVFSEKGEYVVKVINSAGTETTLTFNRRYTSNASSTVFIMVLIIGVVIALFIGLVSRRKSRID